MIELKQIAVTFNQGTALQKKALTDINLSIHPGEFITVVGSNGAGKSTLLNLLSGKVQATQGVLNFDGKDISALPLSKIAESVALVCQDPRSGVCEAFTLEENLSLGFARGSQHGLSSAVTAEKRALFKSMLSPLNLGLENRLQHFAATLSGGERQALSLVMATLRPSKLLLLDEHTAALDPKTRQLILELTDHLIKTQQLTALMITHHLADALHYGSRTLLMHEGKIVHDLCGDARATLNPQELLTYFA